MRNDYIKSLDGIRAISVLLVIFFHSPFSVLRLPFGWIGVQIFFVLSGFLISKNLLQEKEKSIKNYLKSFYWKRTLRIFPIYYLYLAILTGIYLFFTLNKIEVEQFTFHYMIEDFRDNWHFLYTYTYNLKENINFFYDKALYNSELFTHLWSLCVEEQFYLIFPFIVYFLPKKSLKILCFIILLLTPLARYFTYEFFTLFSDDIWFTGGLLYRNPLLQLDAFCLGTLLALANLDKIKKPKVLFELALFCFLGAGLFNLYLDKTSNAFMDYYSLGFGNPEFLALHYKYLYSYLAVNLLGIATILCSIKREIVSKFLENKYLCYIGKISYGIYLYHLFIKALLFLLLETYLPEATAKALLSYNGENSITIKIFQIIIFISYLACVFAVSHLSFKYIESYFLKLKKIGNKS